MFTQLRPGPHEPLLLTFKPCINPIYHPINRLINVQYAISLSCVAVSLCGGVAVCVFTYSCRLPQLFTPSPAALYEWRDSVCRQLDESTGFVLARAQLLKLALAMPRTALGAWVARWACGWLHVARLCLQSLC